MTQTDNLRIVKTRPLIAPAVLEEEIPLEASASEFVASSWTESQSVSPLLRQTLDDRNCCLQRGDIRRVQCQYALRKPSQA